MDVPVNGRSSTRVKKDIYGGNANAKDFCVSTQIEECLFAPVERSTNGIHNHPSPDDSMQVRTAFSLWSLIKNFIRAKKLHSDLHKSNSDGELGRSSSNSRFHDEKLSIRTGDKKLGNILSKSDQHLHVIGNQSPLCKGKHQSIRRVLSVPPRPDQRAGPTEYRRNLLSPSHSSHILTTASLGKNSVLKPSKSSPDLKISIKTPPPTSPLLSPSYPTSPGKQRSRKFSLRPTSLDISKGSPRTGFRKSILRSSLPYGDEITTKYEDWLHEGVASNNFREVSRILEAGKANINYMRPPGVSALHHACVLGNIKMVRLLVEYEADINAKTWAKLSPVQIATSYGHFDVAHFLIEKGADTTTIEDGFQALPD